MIKQTYIHEEAVHNYNAANIIIPILNEFLAPRSILDVGCGTGTWLKIARDLGVLEVFGIDGDYVDPNQLFLNIRENEFLALDLSFPFSLSRKFDLLICLEVAEHLNELSADSFVSSLILHSDYILFSAAIPSQGGQNHLNEQPPEYWIRKFEAHGYNVYDIIRPVVWDLPEVDVWYKQNILFFSKRHLDLPRPTNFYIVHPELYNKQVSKKEQYRLELNKIKEGRAHPFFYLRCFFISLLR